MQSDPGFDAAVPNPETPGAFMPGYVTYMPVNFADPATLAETPVELGVPLQTIYTNQNIGSIPFKIIGEVRSINGSTYVDYPCFKIWITVLT